MNLPPKQAQGAAHAQIAREAGQLQRGEGCVPPATPALEALAAGAISTMQQGVPTQFEHSGRMYWARLVVVGGLLEIYDSPTATKPLTMGMLGAVEVLGHTPHR